jgi:hypothetical protein
MSGVTYLEEKMAAGVTVIVKVYGNSEKQSRRISHNFTAAARRPLRFR